MFSRLRRKKHDPVRSNIAKVYRVSILTGASQAVQVEVFGGTHFECGRFVA